MPELQAGHTSPRLVDQKTQVPWAGLSLPHCVPPAGHGLFPPATRLIINFFFTREVLELEPSLGSLAFRGKVTGGWNVGCGGEGGRSLLVKDPPARSQKTCL